MVNIFKALFWWRFEYHLSKSTFKITLQYTSEYTLCNTLMIYNGDPNSTISNPTFKIIFLTAALVRLIYRKSYKTRISVLNNVILHCTDASHIYAGGPPSFKSTILIKNREMEKNSVLYSRP